MNDPSPEAGVVDVPRPPGQRWKLFGSAGLFLASMAGAWFFHLLDIRSVGPVDVWVRMVHGLVSLVGAAGLWYTVSELFSEAGAPAPARVFWRLIVAGAVSLGVAGLVAAWGLPSSRPDSMPIDAFLGFDLQTGKPLAAAVAVKMMLVAICQVVFVVILLESLAQLVLVKRTATSQRNWVIMLFLMGLTSISTMANPPGDPMSTLQIIGFIITGVFMMVNAFRLSWIVFLSFRRRLVVLALSLGLGIVMLLGMSGPGGTGSSVLVTGSFAYLQHYSYPLATFTSAAWIFGVAYCFTSFLSLLFHLPTAGDYEQRVGERATMHSLAHLVGQVFDGGSLARTIAAAPVEAGSASASWLATPDPRSGTLTPVIVGAHGITIDRINELVDTEAFFEDASHSRKPVVVNSGALDRRMKVRTGDEIGSLLVVPLMARGEVLGALFAAKVVSRGFERDDIETVGIFAAQAAVAMDNARLFEQQIEKERLSRELAIAREVQMRLLPQSVPRMSGVSMAASSVSAQEVGGDYYDFVRLAENRLGIIIADVSGKGTSAAFYMAEMQGIFHSVSRLATSPVDFLSHANTAISHSLDRNVFVSAIYGILDTDDETFTVARAGHCPMAGIRLSSSASYVRSPGLGLGLDRGDLFRRSLAEETIRLEPGDVFVLYTDGVVESRSVAGEEYGYERLLEVLTAHRHEDADELHASILRHLRHFLGGTPYDDDMTLLVIKWHGLPVNRVPESAVVAEESS